MTSRAPPKARAMKSPRADTAPKQAPSEAYVWVWLPEADEPVVAGRLSRSGSQLLFNYGRSYLARPDAMALYAPELPLRAGVIAPLPGLSMPSCIRDASPDAWGRRVLMYRQLDLIAKGATFAATDLDELSCLLLSGSDRVGALDFQASPACYTPRATDSARLSELQQAAERIEQGMPLGPELEAALQHGTSLGGARPKALLQSGTRKLIAKFSTSRDLYNVVKAEYVAMRLAALAGLNVAVVQLESVLGKDVLLIERFDRAPRETPDGVSWRRRAMVSALTLLELEEMMAAYASYEKLAELVRHRFTDPKATAHELFGRIVFNILCGNTDDHARNHAAFWDGATLRLTPAYDVCPQARSGQEASQAMLIEGNERHSQLALCLKAAPQFLLSTTDALAIINRQIQIIMTHWDDVCREARLTPMEKAFLWRRQFLNPFAFFGAPDEMTRPV